MPATYEKPLTPTNPISSFYKAHLFYVNVANQRLYPLMHYYGSCHQFLPSFLFTFLDFFGFLSFLMRFLDFFPLGFLAVGLAEGVKDGLVDGAPTEHFPPTRSGLVSRLVKI